MKKCFAFMALGLAGMLFCTTGCTKNSSFAADNTTYSADQNGASYSVCFSNDGTALETVSYSDEEGSVTGTLTGTYSFDEAESTLTFTVKKAVQAGEDVTAAFGDELTGTYSVQKDGSLLTLTALSGMSFLDPDGTGTVYSAE